MAEENIVIKIKADVGISKEVIEAVTKAMEGLGKTATIVSGNVKVTNKNLEDTNKILGQVAQSAGKAGNELGKAGNSVKKSNIQYTNLALVLQDLPFGFRGIQNNLPALIGGMAGVTGGMYLATSAIIALFTAWDMGAFGATKSTNEWRKSLKETNDEIRNTLNYTNSEVSNLQGLVDVMLDVNSTESVRKKALLELRESIEKVDEAESKKMVNEGTAIGIVYKYIEAIKQKQMQEVVGKRIAEIELSQIEKRNKLAIDTAKANRGIHPIDFFMGNTELDNLNSEIIANETLLRQLEDLRKGATKALMLNPFSDYNAKKGKGGKEKKPEDNYLLNRLKSQQQAYKDDIYAFRDYGIAIINEEEKLAVARAKADGTYEKNKKDIHARYEADRLTNNNLFEANLNKILDDNAKIRTAQEKKELEIQAANRLNIAKGILEINKQFAEDDLRNAILFAKNQTKIIETELGVQDKLNRNNLTNRIQFTEEALAKLVALAAYTFDPKVLAVYLDAIDKINAKLKGMGETWDTTANQIKGILEGVMADSITKFAENIGTALAGGKVDLFGGIGEMIADGAIAIGKALIAYGVALKAFEMAKLDPVLAIVAGAGLVIAGTVLKAKLAPKEKGGAMPFANGGIVSGPTMGLVGEYPGAKTNPEVIAPLDKLKDMIGGGGNGEFVLRGNDLVLALQRSNSSLNLRRGGI
jgi:hypothetical protein